MGQNVLQSRTCSGRLFHPVGAATLKARSQNFALTDDGGVAHHSDNNSLVNKDLYWSYTVTDVLEFQTLGPVDTAWPVTDHYITLH